MIKEVHVPDIGDYSGVDIIEILVKPGQSVKAEESLMTLETDKATVEIPAPFEGIVKEVIVKVGDKVSQGDLIVQIESLEESVSEQKVLVPDIGEYSQVPIIEIFVTPGQLVQAEESLLTLETDKATVEIPAPFSGKVNEILVNIGDKVSQGDALLMLEGTAAPEVNTTPDVSVAPAKSSALPGKPAGKDGMVHAGPGVRRFARELGVDLTEVGGTGRKNRVVESDVKRHVREVGTSSSGLSVEPWPSIDFEKFGTITREPLSRIKKLSGAFLHRNWVSVPHVTQFDEADITVMEAFRQEQKSAAEQSGYKLTPLLFIMKAVTKALQAFPMFNASLDNENSELIIKHYIHLGIAVDTPNGLVVPVIRDVDKKSMVALGKELSEVSTRAREGKLTGQELQGSSFSISSLGGIGGTAFTPIVNVPDVAILGVSKSTLKPVYRGDRFEPRLHLPLSLSYDHRVIDGAQAARFIRFLSEQFSDPKLLS